MGEQVFSTRTAGARVLAGSLVFIRKAHIEVWDFIPCTFTHFALTAHISKSIISAPESPLSGSMEHNLGFGSDSLLSRITEVADELKVYDTHRGTLCKVTRAENVVQSVGSEANESESEVHQSECIVLSIYTRFLSKFLQNVEPALERIQYPAGERDTHFKSRVDLFLNPMLEHDTVYDDAPKDLHMYTEEQFPGYLPENVVFLRFPFAAVQQWSEHNELSYLHGPSLVQHYAVCIATGTNTPILDTTAYVKSFQGLAIWRHMEGMTCDAESTLRHLLLPDRRMLNSTNTARHIVQYLREHHVGLVSKFRVHAEFRDPDRFHYHGAAKGEVGSGGVGEDEDGDNRHAMCLVGYREMQRAGRPYYYFLLQTNWRHKQFVEVDQRYLGSVRAMVHFVCKPQGATGAHLPTLQGRYVESPAGVDACDGEAATGGCDCCGFY